MAPRRTRASTNRVNKPTASKPAPRQRRQKRPALITKKTRPAFGPPNSPVTPPPSNVPNPSQPSQEQFVVLNLAQYKKHGSPLAKAYIQKNVLSRYSLNPRRPRIFPEMMDKGRLLYRLDPESTLLVDAGVAVRLGYVPMIEGEEPRNRGNGKADEDTFSELEAFLRREGGDEEDVDMEMVLPETPCPKGRKVKVGAK